MGFHSYACKDILEVDSQDIPEVEAKAVGCPVTSKCMRVFMVQPDKRFDNVYLNDLSEKVDGDSDAREKAFVKDGRHTSHRHPTRSTRPATVAQCCT